jgi:signal peptidase II
VAGAGLDSQGDGAGQPAVSGRRRGRARRLSLLLALAAAVVGADQGTKLWALSRLAGRPPVVLPGGWVDLRLIANPGAAFSVGSGQTWLFTVFAAGAVLIVPWFAARARSRTQALALGLMLGGATANLLDRLFRAPGPGRGRVVDFIDYHGWFIGNVADIAIVASAAILMIWAVVAPRRETRIAPVPAGPAGRP